MRSFRPAKKYANASYPELFYEAVICEANEGIFTVSCIYKENE
jgi:hypothetical protein